MFQIREVGSADLSDLFQFTTGLYEHHIDLHHEGLLNESEFAKLFTEGYVKGLVLLKNQTDHSGKCPVGTERRIGCMIYHYVLSTLRGKGIYLDHFSILPEFRRRGFGKMMMTRLCQICLASQGTHIKLMYQKGLGLETLYDKWGFVNCTTIYPRLHLFEAYGRSALDKVIAKCESIVNDCTEENGSNSLTRLSIPLESRQNTGCPAWQTINGTLSRSEDDLFQRQFPPKARLVIIAESEIGKTKNSTDISVVSQSSRMCMFTEQICVCTWMGPMVDFSDFAGDISLLNSELFYRELREWLHIYPDLRGAYWEVPFGVENNEEDKHKSLGCVLNRLAVPDQTINEGWNISYLSADKMRLLASFVAPSS